ncbi:MAG: outer membrane beta-barrel protein [Hydrotalea flava]|uniref:porin family protein n=1 Tax=Hydrotalea TaxID=1004300 RepID=UPI000944DE93|nr:MULTISPECIES: porin family protein [Hydrotalea]NIM34535.1 outer membrane beta-barrel protein [Hydrotalea flava]NIM37375.1 outer membrane beta-barrel protein [Hydrotalea flava]NIN02560.1 outer membrane beta-barrel protein [Hydrotalea flava]NIN14220.1 outer membrane beta-barrel protein [Hydrotalea flava]NIO93301.1 outer membrane beta-barrel protein [Hydrotalea flava]
MRKFFLIIFCLCTTASFAQLKLGVEVGYNTSGFIDQGSDIQYFNLSRIPTFQAGIVAEQTLNKHFSASSGLIFFQKGGRKDKTVFATTGASTTSKFNYIQIPLNLQYSIPLNKTLKALVGAGFYGAVGISGTEKGTDEEISGNTTVVNNKVKFSNNPYYTSGTTYVKPLDFGYDVLVGLAYHQFEFKATLTNGFGNIYPTGSTRFANSVIGFTVAYLVPWK